MSDFVLQVVDELTKPVRYKHLVEKRERGRLVIRDGRPVIDVVKTELPCLLDQLEQAVMSSTGGPSGKGSLASERSVLDADALYQAVRIGATIRDWCRDGAVRRTEPLARHLRHWYTTTLATGLTEAQERFHTDMMRRWVGFIRGHLDPTREMDLPWACPRCSAMTWWARGEEFTRPLVVRYQPQGEDMVSRARAICRSCEQVWTVRELAYELEHPEVVKSE